MALTIKDPKADRLATALASVLARHPLRPSSPHFASVSSARNGKEQSVEALVEDVMEISRHCASLPLLDQRRPDEIIGYDENGLPQ